ncbi:uncharacterized protein LTR77_007666 [Saxophila tyrrhenica]|uniref:Uncharacterized protein n=1 Tax=Saxophila tyrrhenica TaxID=1690608 RepID=A0AAV9P2N6_9PEZI|nr:hypothetical protein LTR77_007666 [Saxophila tyrrhenica]
MPFQTAQLLLCDDQHVAQGSKQCRHMAYFRVCWNVEQTFYQFFTLMSSSSDIKPFRMVAEARGGTFTFRKPASSTPNEIDENNHTHVDLIGTYHCNTCVAIYFPIDQRRCFMMHCNAWTRYSEPTNYAEPEAGEELKREIMKKLQQEAKENDWDPTLEGFAEVVYAACPKYKVDYEGDMVKTGGYYAVEAVREFLKNQADAVDRNASQFTALVEKANTIRHQANGFMVHTDLQGFVVHHASRKMVATFKANQEGLYHRRSPADLGLYRPVTVLGLEICKWSICVDDQEAIVLEQMFRAKQKGVKLTEEDMEELEINRLRAGPERSSPGPEELSSR